MKKKMKSYMTPAKHARTLWSLDQTMKKEKGK